MNTRLQPIVRPRSFTIGAAQLRIGHLIHVIGLLLATGAVAIGTVAIADVVRAITRSS